MVVVGIVINPPIKKVNDVLFGVVTVGKRANIITGLNVNSLVCRDVKVGGGLLPDVFSGTEGIYFIVIVGINIANLPTTVPDHH